MLQRLPGCIHVYDHYFQISHLKSEPDFMWRFLEQGVHKFIKFIKMVLVTWPRWPQCPYISQKPLRSFFFGTRSHMVLGLGMARADLETWHVPKIY